MDERPGGAVVPTARFSHEASVDAVRAYFDVLGAQEWDRLASDVTGRVSFEVHRRFLPGFVNPGMRVLEVGAGPGRFTIELASLGATVVVTDLSPVQLKLNAEYVARAATQPPGSGQHTCRVFRSRDVAALAKEAGATLRGLSASNWASLGDPETLKTLAADADRWSHFLDNEVSMCAEPGAVDGGTHLLFAASRW